MTSLQKGQNSGYEVMKFAINIIIIKFKTLYSLFSYKKSCH